MEIFFRIFMNTKFNGKLYLRADKGNSCKWDKKSKAIWFNTYSEAEKFCKQYFKNFNNYQIEEFEYNIMKL